MRTASTVRLSTLFVSCEQSHDQGGGMDDLEPIRADPPQHRRSTAINEGHLCDV
jgi:hypothetical protein